MPLLMKNLYEDKRYALLLRNRPSSVAEIETQTSTKEPQPPATPTPTTTTTPTPSAAATSSSTTSTSSPPQVVVEQSTTNNGKTKQKKTVSFHRYVEVKDTIALSDMTEEEHRDTWYTKHELKTVKGLLAMTVRMMVSGKLDDGDTDEHCARGLEIRTSAGCQKRRANKRRGWEAVLGEQARQFNRGMTDDEAISRAFIQANLICRKAALMNGLKDELESLKINRQIIKQNKTKADNNNNNNNNNNMDSSAMTVETLLKRTERKGLSRGTSLRIFLKKTVAEDENNYCRKSKKDAQESEQRLHKKKQSQGEKEERKNERTNERTKERNKERINKGMYTRDM
eukprot:CAMPEP_0116565782 /NCGR_PEP_ID=MMETSP0397-20121206/14084_1 /TAXON_ID=216820 /ORGANISM="Cyclophora tenuis, Strain ECT3854" /LENGTH=340 /DNA_ID=CAMNT_0004092583 /DNA_START=53 /DNA_END=1076 /DNA_ORIENTATION=+